MKYFLFLLCFLIISCDLPSEANKDCNGTEGGLASYDDCGRCTGGSTNIAPNQDKDCDNKCFGDSYLDNCGVCDDIAVNDGITCAVCNDSIIELSDVIGSLCDCDGNIIDNCGECGGEGFQDCMCNDLDNLGHTYILDTELVDCLDNSSIDVTYSIGEQLNCASANREFDICYPEDCSQTFKLKDYSDKIILILYEFDW